MDLLRILLHRLEHEYPCYVTDEETKRYAKDFKVLKKLGLLTSIDSPTAILCPSCKSEFVTIKNKKNGEQFTDCTQCCTAGRQVCRFHNRTSYEVDMDTLLREISHAIDSEAAAFELKPGEAWQFTSPSYSKTKVVFCRNLEQARHFRSKTIKAITPSGQSHPALSDVDTISISDCIECISESGIEFHTSWICELCKTTEECWQETTPSIHSHLAPFSRRIVRYLFDIRDNRINSKTVQELANAMSKTSNPRSVSNALRAIQTHCSKHRLPPLIRQCKNRSWRFAENAKSNHCPWFML